MLIGDRESFTSTSNPLPAQKAANIGAHAAGELRLSIAISSVTTSSCTFWSWPLSLAPGAIARSDFELPASAASTCPTHPCQRKALSLGGASAMLLNRATPSGSRDGGWHTCEHR